MKSKILSKKKLESIYELPKNTWKMFEEDGCPTPSEMWEFEMEVEMEEGDPPIPDDLLFTCYVDAIEKQNYKGAEKIKKELESRGFTITIKCGDEKNKGTITFEKKDG